jgi:predicted dehydrogenase
MFSVGIIGAGKISGLFDKPEISQVIKTHAQAVYNNPSLDLVSVVDVNGDNLNKFASEWKVKNKFLKIGDFLSSDMPDIVSVCSPNETHYNLIVKLLNHRKPPKVLFVEKPVCVFKKELEDISRIAKKSDCKIVLNHTRRFDPSHKKLLKIISSGFLGKCIDGKFTYYGGWLNNGIHLLDLIILLFGAKFEFTNTNIKKYGRKNDPCIDTILDYGSFSIDISSFDEKYYQLFEGEFRFSNGRLRYRDFGNQIVIDKSVINKMGQRVLDYEKSVNLKGLIAPLKFSYKYIVNYLRSGNIDYLGSVLFQDIKPVMERLFSINV